MLPRKHREPVRILGVRGRSVVRGAQLISHAAGRGLRLGRALALLSRVFPQWLALPTVGPDGRPFPLDLSSDGFGWLVSGWRTRHLETTFSRLPQNGVALDIGANVGTVARFLSAFVPAGRVVAFEPSPSSFARLCANVASVPHIRADARAIGETTGPIQFAGEDTPSDLRSAVTSGGVQVEAIRLVDWAKEARVTRIDLIKVDVEGFEEEVLVPAEALLRAMRPTVVFEFIPSFARERSRHRGEALFPLFRRIGYRVGRLDQSGNISPDFTTPSGDNPDLTNDYVALP